VFDLDGTLVESAPDLAHATDHVLRRFGRPPVGLDAVRQMVGDGARALVMRGFEITGGVPDSNILDSAFNEFMTYYGNHLADHTLPYDGAVETLDVLRARGCRLGICTNKPVRLTRLLLDRLGLTPRFDAIMGGDSLGFRKPHGGHLLGTLAAMGKGPETAVMVGDSANDVLAARACGVPVIAVSFGYSRIPARDLAADAVVDCFGDLAAAIAAVESGDAGAAQSRAPRRASESVA
jgi:phosphoglycolate phosphatase